MPTPGDILTEEVDEDDPDDELRLQLDQGQGNNLAGGPQSAAQWLDKALSGPPQGPPPGMAGSPQPVAPSPNVPGPLAALAKPGKPRIKLKNRPPPPAVKKIKPKIKLKASAYGRTI